MKHTHRGLVALLLLGLASNTYATKWNSVASTSEGTVSIAQGSEKHIGHLASVWLQTVFITPRLATGTTATSMQSRWVIDCKLDTYRATSIVMFDAKGETVSTDTVDQTDHDIRPDSVAAMVQKKICK